jgi:hypothetical protein
MGHTISALRARMGVRGSAGPSTAVQPVVYQGALSARTLHREVAGSTQIHLLLSHTDAQHFALAVFVDANRNQDRSGDDAAPSSPEGRTRLPGSRRPRCRRGRRAGAGGAWSALDGVVSLGLQKSQLGVCGRRRVLVSGRPGSVLPAGREDERRAGASGGERAVALAECVVVVRLDHFFV